MTTTSQQQREKILGGLWGAVVGDALGVPVEFQGRERLKANPVVDMREYGSHDQPRGTWSDDSSLMLCSVDSLNERGYDLDDLGQRFVRWYNEEIWTPWGEVFDIGNATFLAIANLSKEVKPELAGGDSGNSNGNGSLMRILPIGLYFANAPTAELLRYAERASCLTHRHLRSQMACGIYCVLVAALLEGLSPAEAYQQTIEKVRPVYQELPYGGELPHFEPVLSGKIGEYPEDKIKSSGYVVHSLEASIWCLLTSNSYAEAVLKAVNLGEDTDTTATITGGLAGIYFGLSTIPAEWLNALARKDDLTTLFDKFAAKLAG
jgi:ADP-ribosylglycohydrolase